MAKGLSFGDPVRRIYRAASQVWVQPDDEPGRVLERDGAMVLVKWPGLGSRSRGEWCRAMDLERAGSQYDMGGEQRG